MSDISLLQKNRYHYQPKLPKALSLELNNIVPVLGNTTTSVDNQQELKQLFPYTYGKNLITFAEGSNNVELNVTNIGVILSGGQAPGGHNVIAGLFDGLKKANPEGKLYGFLGGPSGLIDGHYVEITTDLMAQYRNTGGFDIIQSGRTKMESTEQFEKALANCQKLNISALVVIGGDDSNTNAAILAEYFMAKKALVQVIGCPKTIDGDLKNGQIETSFGFDTACKTYAELIGNIARDANSAQKYWHFIKLMGRSASHIALECALQTQPNVTIISEEVEAKEMTLADVVDMISQSVIARSEKGHNFGVVLIPEGLIEFIPEVKTLIAELNNLLALHADSFTLLNSFQAKQQWLASKLTRSSLDVYESFPLTIQEQLIMDRDPHGNVQVSAIETEKMLISMVAAHLEVLKANNHFSGKFNGIGHFFGYEGRCAFPSNFDADYCYSLGFTAFLLIRQGFSGYISSIQNLHLGAEHWVAGGAPLTMMMNMEIRHGHAKPVIRKALVELDGKPFKKLLANRRQWATESCYLFPGAIQYYGPSEVCDQTTKTLKLELE